MSKSLFQKYPFREAVQLAWRRKGLDAQQVAVAVKIQKSHRKIGAFIVIEVLEAIEQKKKGLKNILGFLEHSGGGK